MQPLLMAISTIGTDASPDFDYPPACMVMWGANIAFTHLPNYVRLEKALKKGMKLVVIDPRKTGLAERADLWLQPRPKTDLALALGMMNIIIHEELYDKSFVDERTVGFDKTSGACQRLSFGKSGGNNLGPCEKK